MQGHDDNSKAGTQPRISPPCYFEGFDIGHFNSWKAGEQNLAAIRDRPVLRSGRSDRLETVRPSIHNIFEYAGEGIVTTYLSRELLFNL